jgi:hypothetical protein
MHDCIGNIGVNMVIWWVSDAYMPLSVQKGGVKGHPLPCACESRGWMEIAGVKLDDLRAKRMYKGAHGEELSTPTPVLLFGNSLKYRCSWMFLGGALCARFS